MKSKNLLYLPSQHGITESYLANTETDSAGRENDTTSFKRRHRQRRSRRPAAAGSVSPFSRPLFAKHVTQETAGGGGEAVVLMADTSEGPVYLTELERRVVRLRDGEGMKWAEIGRQLGMDRRNAQKAHQRAHSKMAQHGPAPSQEAQEELQEACKGALEKVRGKIDDKMLSEGAAEVAWKALWHILNNERQWERASIRELASACGQMIDKRQLLRGEPTQITKIQDIRELDEMAKLLHEEMERRGLMIDVTPEKVG